MTVLSKEILQPNKTCTGQVGFYAIYEHFSGFEFFCSQAESTPVHLPVTQTVGPHSSSKKPENRGLSQKRKIHFSF